MLDQLLPHFATASVQGIPLVLVIAAAVYFLKRLGLRGRALVLASAAIGFVLGTGYQIAVLPGPLPAEPLAAYAILFGIVVYGLVLGFVASLLVDLTVDVLTKALRSLGVIALSSPLNIADLASPTGAPLPTNLPTPPAGAKDHDVNGGRGE